MYALWGGGLLDQTLSASALGLNTSDFELFFPGLTDLTIEMDALLPPAVVTGTGREMFDLQLGDIHLVLYNGNATTGDVLIDVYFSAFMGMDLSATSDTLSATMGAGSLFRRCTRSEYRWSEGHRGTVVGWFPTTTPTHRCIGKYHCLKSMDLPSPVSERIQMDRKTAFSWFEEISSRSSVYFFSRNTYR